MEQIKQIKLPNGSTYEVVDAAAREQIDQKADKNEATTTVTDDGEGNIVLTNVAIEEGAIVEEVDPTVPDWAKQPNKPTYTAEEVGARPADWMPTAEEIGVVVEESDPTVPAWAKASTPPAETDPTVPDWAKTPEKPAYGWDEITDKPFTDGKLNAECLPDDIGVGSVAADKITAGTFATTNIKAMNGTDYSTARIRNIYAGTTNLTAGSSTLANGSIYLVYE